MELSTGKKDLIRAIYVPAMLLIFIWISKGIEVAFGVSFEDYGIYPKSIRNFPGIILAPLIHADFHHLTSNSFPLFLLSTAIFYFYRPFAVRIVVLLWVTTGLCVWIAGREAYHIGASGLIYGEASFLFFSGLIRRIPTLAAISLLVIFLYGSMIWGIFPFFPEISWESHLFGGITGLTFAIVYRKEGPTRQEIKEEDDDDETEDDNTVKTDELNDNSEHTGKE